MPQFQIVSDFQATGDQPQAVDRIIDGLDRSMVHQSLMGVTGSGKTFTMANVVERVQRPTLVIAHNKTLAAQLATEFKEFFPENAVEYFVSYYNYYQPEAYLPRTDLYIEKDADINEELDKLRHAATRALLTRRDVLIVASVSCIFGLGSPEEYQGFMAHVQRGEIRSPGRLSRQLIDMQYERNDFDLARGRFRVRGDTLEILPAYETVGVRIEFWGDEVERIVELDPLTGEVLAERNDIDIYPAKHFVTSEEKLQDAIRNIETELDEQLKILNRQGQAAGGAEAGAAHPVRHGDDARDGLLRGRRELLPPPRGARAREHSLHPDGLLPGGLPALHRRVAHDAAPDQGHVQRRPSRARRCW